jgi:hypothetical protein
MKSFGQLILVVLELHNLHSLGLLLLDNAFALLSVFKESLLELISLAERGILIVGHFKQFLELTLLQNDKIKVTHTWSC